MYTAKRKTVRVGKLALLREVFQVPHPSPPPPAPVVLKTYRRTIEEILADTTPGPNDCLIYNDKGPSGGHINPVTGYGYVIWHGKQWPVHRLVALYTKVKHPGWRDWLASQRWIHVCHTCDNPPCINLDHLVIATAQYNTLDSIAKGRFMDKGKWLARARERIEKDLNEALTDAGYIEAPLAETEQLATA